MLKYLRCLKEKLHVYSAKTQEREESAEFRLKKRNQNSIRENRWQALEDSRCSCFYLE